MSNFTSKLVSSLIYWIMMILGGSCRIKVAEGEDLFKEVVARKKPVIYCFWHNRIFFLSYYLYKNSAKKGLNITALISQSKDGEIISDVVKKMGGESARGSTSKGGVGAIKALMKRIRQGYAIVVTPDGPRGPVYEFQPGAIYVSAMTEVDILPMTCVFEKAWVFKSWDGFMVPKPFSRVNIHFYPLEKIKKELDPKIISAESKKIQKILLKQSEFL